MAGEIATAFVAIAPSMKGFGSQLATQMGGPAVAAGRRAGQQAGVAFVGAAAKESSGWFSQTAQMAVKNVALYGSMYAAIQGVRTGVNAMFDAMVGFNSELEQADIGFTTLLRSSSAAKEQMAWIKDFAKETPFQYEDLVGYSQQLIALGFNAEQSREVLEATGDAAAALGRGSESIARINLALGQMWTKGKVQSQEMLQLTEAGIGAWQILADRYGATVAEVQDAVTRGLISAKEAVPALLEGMEAQFGGLMEKQSATFAGMVSNIQDTLMQELAKAGEPLFQELTAQARELLDALDDPEVVEFLDQLGESLAEGAHALGEFLKFAIQWRDVILAAGVGYTALKVASGWTVKHFSAEAVAARQSAGAWAAATEAQRAYAAGLTRTSAVLAGVSKLKLGPLFSTVGMVGGSALLFDGWSRSAEQATADTKDFGQSLLGMGEAMGGGALAGAALGSIIPGLGTAVGAAGGAVVGLVGNLWQMQAAMDAANKDVSAVKDALTDMGVEARIADLATKGLTNDQLAAAGGFDAIAAAMRAGTYSDYVAGLKDQSAAIHEQIDALEKKRAAMADDAAGDGRAALEALGRSDAYEELNGKIAELTGQSQTLDDALKTLGVTGGAWATVNEQIAYSNYAAAYASDMQTGSLGAQTDAAWQAVLAQGTLSASFLQTQLRAEGLAGTAGYLTQMIAGIPKGAAINFSTNANDVLVQIINLRAAAEAGFSKLGMTADGYVREMERLQAKYKAALSGASVKLSLPTGTSGGGAGGAVRSAVDEAARKLEQDRNAQLRFGDAFGSLMESALSGEFEQFRDRLADEIESLTRDGYKKAADELRRLSPALSQAAADYAALTNKLGAASDAYDDLTGKMRDQYEASRDQILGLGKLTDAQSFDQLAYLLGETTNAATQYQDVLTQLKDQGLSKDLWDQLAQAGPESMGLAQSILAQGQSGIDQINSLSGGLVDAADSMGDLVSQSMYQQGADAMQAYIEGLKSQSAALESQLESIANNVLDKTAGAITPGNAGYLPVSAEPKTTVNNYNFSINAEDLDDLDKIREWLAALDQAPTTQLVNQAGTVTS